MQDVDRKSNNMDEDDKIVEFLDGKDWSKTTLRDVKFVCNVLRYSMIGRIRYIEGSLDGGATWKEIYEHEFKLLGKGSWDLMQWRIKEK